MASDSIKPEDLEDMEWSDEDSWEDELLKEEAEAGITGAGIEDFPELDEDLDEWEEYIDSYFNKIMFSDE